MSGKYWYMTSYFFMYLFIPALNSFAEKADKFIFKTVLGCIFVLSSLAYLIREDSFKLNNGYSALWLAIMYLLGAYMKNTASAKNEEAYSIAFICFLRRRKFLLQFLF